MSRRCQKPDIEPGKSGHQEGHQEHGAPTPMGESRWIRTRASIATTQYDETEQKRKPTVPLPNAL